MAKRRINGEGSVYRRGDGRWAGAVHVTNSAGKRVRIQVYGATRADVQAKVAARVQRETQGIPSPDRRWLVGDFLDYWLPIAKNTRRPTTYVSYEMIVRLYLKPGLGHHDLARLNVSTVQSYLDGQLSEGVSIRTAQKIRTVLSAALTRAQREELVVRNVAHHLELPTWHRKVITPWTFDQARAFLTAAQGHEWQPAFVLLVVYGMRRSEVLGLRWHDIDFTNHVIHVRHQIQRHDGNWQFTPVKTNAGERDLPLLPFVEGALRTLIGDDTTPEALVFQTRFGTPVEGGNLLRAFTRMSQQAGLPRITLHHLRHTAATFLKNLGLPARDTQLVLGHAHISTTQQLYQHGDFDGQREALSRLQSAVTTAGGSTRCCQSLLSNTKKGPSKGPIGLVSSLVAPPRLELGTQGSSELDRHPFEHGIPGVTTVLNGIRRTSKVGRVAVTTAVISNPQTPEGGGEMAA